MAVSIEPSAMGRLEGETIAQVRNDPGELSVTLQSVQVRMEPVRLYKRRYAMLAMFAALGFLQCSVWNTWGPVSSTVKIAYPNFTTSTIATLSLWGPLSCIFGTVFFMVLIQKRGLRLAMVVSTFLMALGCSVRCITTDPEYFTITAHLGAVLNGLAGISVGIAPSLLSTLWFPVSFRTTATGIGCTMNQLGNAGGFFLGPYLVHTPEFTLRMIYDEQKSYTKEIDHLNFAMCYKEDECTTEDGKPERLKPHSLWSNLYNYGGEQFRVSSFIDLRDDLIYVDHSGVHNTTKQSVSTELQQYLREWIYNYMVITAGLSVGLFVMVLAFFEDEPPTPPVPLVAATERRWTASITASRRSRVGGNIQSKRTLAEVARLTAKPFTNPSFCLMLVCYSLTLGINVAWTSVLDVNLEPLGVTMKDSSWMGVYITFGGVILALIVSRISDSLMECHKVLIIILLFLSAVSYTIFLMCIKRCFPFNMWVLQVSAVLGGSINYAVSPLFFELFMEIGHPAPEDVLGSVITVFWNIAGIVFLFMMEVKNNAETVSSVIWMDYLLVGQAALSCFLMWFVKEEYKRSGVILQDRMRSSGRQVPPILEEEHLSCEFASSESELYSSDSDVTIADDGPGDSQLFDGLPINLAGSVAMPHTADDVRLLIDSIEPAVSSSSDSNNSTAVVT